MPAFAVRPKLSLNESADILNRAQWFFENYPERRVFRVGDEDGSVWFKVRRGHLVEDVLAHSSAIIEDLQ